MEKEVGALPCNTVQSISAWREAHRFLAAALPSRGRQVLTPRPLPGMVRPEVMVETWEAGRSVSHYIRQPSPVNSTVVSLGVDTYLQMLLADNFVHTDLHPGA